MGTNEAARSDLRSQARAAFEGWLTQDYKIPDLYVCP
jgi:hypothetical protein